MVQSPEFEGRVFELLKPQVSLGRLPDNDIHIDHGSVSGHHAMLTLDGEDFLVQDMNSTNGTRVNGAKISQHKLTRGDLLQVGNIQLSYESEAVGAAQPLPEISDGSFFLLGLRYAIDCGGFDGRHYWNEFQISPELNVMFPKGWFVTLFPSPDIRISFENSGKLFLPLNIMVGKMFGEKKIMSTEFGFPMINDYYVYDFKMETRIGFFF